MYRKQQCLAITSLGTLCGCQALSNGRCRAHTPVLFTPASAPASAPRRKLITDRGLLASFGVWRDLLGNDFGQTLHQAPVAYSH